MKTGKPYKSFDWTTYQIFDGINTGTVSFEEFEAWVHERESMAAEGGFQTGVDQAQYSAGWEY